MNTTYYVAFRLVTELLLFTFLTVMTMERRKYFFVRITGCLVICYTFSVLRNRVIANNFILSILWYILIFMLVVLTVYVCFKISFYLSLYFGVSGYAMQFFNSKLHNFLEKFIIHKMTITILIAFYLILLLLSCIFFYILFARRLKQSIYYKYHNYSVLLLSIGLVLFVIVLNRILSFSKVYENLNVWVDFVITAYGMAFGLMIICIQLGMFQRSKLEKEKSEIELIWHMKQKQMEISKDTIELINIKCHDLNQYLTRFEKIFTDFELNDLKSRVSIFSSSVKTENEILDIILAEKSLFCEKYDIKITCMADGKLLKFMNATDIYSLFGNALQNSVEAAMKIEKKEMRQIGLIVKEKMGLISIHFENYYDGINELINVLPETQKADKNYHGFGMKSIKMIVEKYNGTMSIIAKDKIFMLDILFYTGIHS